MSISHVMQGGWIPLRPSECSADDTALDPTEAGTTLWDFTSKSYVTIGPEANEMIVIFVGEGDDSDSFACNVWAKAEGPGPAEKICEVTGHYGVGFSVDPASANLQGADVTTHKVADNLVMEATNNLHYGDVSISDVSNGRACRMRIETRGLPHWYFEFYNVGAATEAHTVIPFGRVW